MRFDQFCLFSVLLLICCLVPFDALAESEDTKTFLQTLNSFGPSLVQKINKPEKYGEIHGKIKSFTIHQDRESYRDDRSVEGNSKMSSSLALFLYYNTPEFENGLSGGLEYVNSAKVFDAQHSGGFDDGHFTHNSKFQVLNQLFVDYKLRSIGLEKSHIKVGRQATYNDFFKAKAIRQKAQTMEGVVLFVEDIPNISGMVGFVNRFSGWSSRNDSDFQSDFINVGRFSGLSYDTSGGEFFSIDYTGIPNTDARVYYWWLDDMFSVVGNKASYTFDLDNVKVIPGIHWALQKENGRMKEDGIGKIRAGAFEASTKVTIDDTWIIQPGFMIVTDNEFGEVNDFQNPFDSKFMADAQKAGDQTRAFVAGARTGVLKIIWKKNRTKIKNFYFRTLHPKDSVDSETDRGTYDQQMYVNIVQGLSDNLTGTLQLVYGTRGSNVVEEKDLETKEVRIVLEYKF